MTPDEIRTIVESAIDDKVMIQYWYYLATLIVAGLTAYIGAYVSTRAKNLATQEDIQKLTAKVEDVKAEYKLDFRRKEQSAAVAEILAKYHYGGREDPQEFIQLAWELSLWLPADAVRQLTMHLREFQRGETDPKNILIYVRKMLHGENDDLAAEDIVHFGPNPG